MGLRRTPLHAVHAALGARLVEFGGFEMPVQYAGIKHEHAAVRERAGVFDVSHMGQIHFSGPAAAATLERLLTCPVDTLAHGAVRYGLLCNDGGGVVDDVTVYRVADDVFFLCVNAANIEKDLAWILAHAPEDAGVRDRSAETGLLAVQGPEAPQKLVAIGATDAPGIRRFRFAPALVVGGIEAIVSRTGYTGSDGYEVYVGAGDVARVFEALVEAGAEPCGLGARDTLRLEAALPLYGHELDDETSPLEAGLDRFVKRERGGFLGAEAIEKRAAEGHARRLVGFELVGRGVARAGYPLLAPASAGGGAIGAVTSGAPSPTLGKAIGLGYIRREFAEAGTAIQVEIRGNGVEARVVPTPFVRARQDARAPRGRAR
ncbi:MAG: glycine cleavage system aminomethyltransferase GcvT [Myxococcota bacterium]|nr:glycine cleavage system aminomethyltransferase GcvT [Myxococcales bacterium]